MPILANSLKLMESPSRLRAPTAIMATVPLKGVVAPPKLLPRTSADQTAAEFVPKTPLIIGTKVRATAMLLTIALVMPLNQRVVILAVKVLPPNVWNS